MTSDALLDGEPAKDFINKSSIQAMSKSIMITGQSMGVLENPPELCFALGSLNAFGLPNLSQ